METLRVLQLVHDLEHLSAEEQYYAQQPAEHAQKIFMDRQREVISTTGKLQRELAGVIRYNPRTLLGIEYPLSEALDSMADLFVNLEEIRHAALYSVEDLPARAGRFAKKVESHIEEGEAVMA
jgi:hypothetical protein